MIGGFTALLPKATGDDPTLPPPSILHCLFVRGFGFLGKRERLYNISLLIFYSKYLDGIITQTTLAHRLMLKAWKMGGQTKQQALLTTLFKVFFEELANIGDTNVLADAAVSADLMTKEEVGQFPYVRSRCLPFFSDPGIIFSH